MPGLRDRRTTCDVNATPRGCTSAQTTCPAPHPGCPHRDDNGVSCHRAHGACTALDLSEAQSACAGERTRPGAPRFLQTLTSNGAARVRAVPAAVRRPVRPGARGSRSAPRLSCRWAATRSPGCYASCEAVTCAQCHGVRLLRRRASTQVTAGSCSALAQGLDVRELGHGDEWGRAVLQPGELRGLRRLAQGRRRAPSTG